MQTLSAQNHFTSTLGISNICTFGLEESSESTLIAVRSQPVNMRERFSLKVQEQPEPKLDSRTEQPRISERSSITQSKDMSSTNERRATLDIQPPRNNSPAVFASESCAAIPSVMVDEEAPEREYFMRCVVLGSENTGKHTLVGANLAEELGEHTKTGSNFFAKTAVSYKTTKKYHFWVRTLGDDSATKDALWKTYYKWATTFVFVYDITNKESFEALKKAVESVMKVVPREKFFGVLVGNKNELHGQREVSYDEAVDFKLQYNFSHFIETCAEIEKETPQVIPRLDAKLKLTFESI